HAALSDAPSSLLCRSCEVVVEYGTKFINRGGCADRHSFCLPNVDWSHSRRPCFRCRCSALRASGPNRINWHEEGLWFYLRLSPCRLGYGLLGRGIALACADAR